MEDENLSLGMIEPETPGFGPAAPTGLTSDSQISGPSAWWNGLNDQQKSSLAGSVGNVGKAFAPNNTPTTIQPLGQNFQSSLQHLSAPTLQMIQQQTAQQNQGAMAQQGQYLQSVMNMYNPFHPSYIGSNG